MNCPTNSTSARLRAAGLGIALGLPLFTVCSPRVLGAPQGAADSGSPLAKKTPAPYLSVVAPAPLRFQKPDAQNPPGKALPWSPPAKPPGARDPSADVVVTPGLPTPADRPAAAPPVGPAALRDISQLPPSAATYHQQ
jgi:hypothetical protein